MPDRPGFVIFMYPRLTLEVFAKRMPWLIVAWIVPPEPLLVAPPSPVTFRPPLDPVLFSKMPLVAPLDEILWKFSPLGPMVVF